MRGRIFWISLILILILGGLGFYFRDNLMTLISPNNEQASDTETAGGFVRQNADASEQNAAQDNLSTVAIRPATNLSQVSASGNIAVASEYPLTFQVDGMVTQINVDIGDQVQSGDLLLGLDTTDLDRALEKVKLTLAANEVNLAKLMEPANENDILAAQIALAAAQENLSDVQADPNSGDIADAQANLAAAQAKYQDLLSGNSDDELTQLSVSLEKARLELDQAQAAYDAIAFREDIGRSSQAVALQQATIDYEAALASFNVSIAGPSNADLQSALSSIQSAQTQLDKLFEPPTQAELASAIKQVVDAETNLASLLEGPNANDLRAAEIQIEQAQLDLTAAEADLALAKLYAPINGTVMSVDLDLGQRVSSGAAALSLADLTQLELTINVAEVDIRKVSLGQNAQISIDALPDRTFQGVVERIAPSSDSQQGVVNYPVVVRLTEGDLAQVRPGMTAVATLLSDTDQAAWLVPSNAIRSRNGNSVIMVLRNNAPTPVPVTAQGTQGEWTIVQSAELQSSDQVLGSVNSLAGEDTNFRGGFGSGRPPGGFGR